MKKVKYIPVVLLLVLFSCTSSERNTRIYSIMGRVTDTVVIPESVTIYPDTDGYYRPYDIDIWFENPCSGFLSFRCASFYVSVNKDNSTNFELQDFVFRFPNELKDSDNLRFYNEVILKNLYPAGTNNVFIDSKYIYNIFMHGGKYPPYEIWKK